MARKFAQGKYTPVNSSKYVGKKDPTYRSGWELTFCQFCDNNPNVIQWASESISIPYKNPLTGRNTFYVPDFFIVYQDKNNKKRAELIEVKPRAQTTMENAKSIHDKAAVAVNHAKWVAANAWAKQNGIVFRVITEADIFHQGNKRR
jgi:hypothetical protein